MVQGKCAGGFGLCVFMWTVRVYSLVNLRSQSGNRHCRRRRRFVCGRDLDLVSEDEEWDVSGSSSCVGTTMLMKEEEVLVGDG